jgi:hypothetical protein
LNENRSGGKKVLNDDAEFYLALAYLKKGETKKSTDIFQKIHDNKNHLYNDQVTDLFLFRLKLLALKNK